MYSNRWWNRNKYGNRNGNKYGNRNGNRYRDRY